MIIHRIENGTATDVEYTQEELLQEAETLARNSSLKCGAFEAYTRVLNGELEGTMFASRIQQLFFLIGSYDTTES